MSANTKRLKLHLGCGPRHIPDWVHIDQVGYDHIDYVTAVHDLHMIPDGSCEIVYASHVLEYYDWEEARNVVLPEWFRVLTSGGILRLSVPDFEVISRLYQAGFKLEWFIGPLCGRMDAGDTRIYHKCIYDEEVLRKMLEDVGFTEYHRYDCMRTEHADVYDHSRGCITYKRFDGIENEGMLLSLNVEVRK